MRTLVLGPVGSHFKNLNLNHTTDKLNKSVQVILNPKYQTSKLKSRFWISRNGDLRKTGQHLNFNIEKGGNLINNRKDEIFEKEYAENIKRAGQIAQNKEYILNSDEERVKKVVGLMANNYLEFGKYYCPCKQSHPLDPRKDRR